MVQPISDGKIETLKAVFAETGKIDVAAKSAGVSWSTAKKHIDNRDAFESIREQKRVDIIDEIKTARVKIIQAMTDSAHLAKASVQELATAFGILTDKELLMQGKATARTETLTVDPAARLTPDEMEAAAKIRAKLAGDGLG